MEPIRLLEKHLRSFRIDSTRPAETDLRANEGRAGSACRRPRYLVATCMAALGLLSSRAVLAAEATRVVENKISRVTVMVDRAEVTRSIKATVLKGQSIVIVEDLPVDLDETSLRVESGEGAVVQGVSSNVVKRLVQPPLAKADLLKRLHESNASLDALEASVLGLRRQVELVRSYRGRTLDAIGLQTRLPKENLPGGRLDLPTWGQAIQLLAQQEAKALNETRDLEVKRIELQQEGDELREQMNAHDKPKIKQVRHALVGISSPVAGPISFDLVYRVNGPTWRIRYDLRFDAGKKMLDVEAYGVVLQASGEDWKEVDLVLSTRMPASGLRAPNVRPLVLKGLASETVKAELASLVDRVAFDDIPAESEAEKIGKEGKEEKGAEGEGEMEAPAPVVGAPKEVRAWRESQGLEGLVALESSLTGQAFKVLEKASLVSAEEPQQIPIMKASVPASLILEAVPANSSMVYRRVTARNDSGRPLLAGRATLFLDGNLVGVTSTRTVAPGTDLSLSFGSVDGLAVTSSSRDKSEKEAGETIHPQLGKRTYQFARTYTIENSTNAPVSVRVLDTVPISEVEQVEVAVDQKKSSPYEELGKGILAFTASVTAGDKSPVALYYAISLPEELKF